MNCIINNYTNNTNFTGTVKNSPLYNFAAEYAKSIEVSSPDWDKLKLFINTIRAIKNDDTKNEFIIDTVEKNFKKRWLVKYGNYESNLDIFTAGNQDLNKYDEKTGKNAFHRIIEFGKRYFKISAISKSIQEFSPSKNHLKMANIYKLHAKKPKNKDVASRLIAKADIEIIRAEKKIKPIRENLLDNL